MRLPIIIAAPVNGQRAFWCKGCGMLHVHVDRGDGVYLPQCPPGSLYRRWGYYLKEQA